MVRGLITLYLVLVTVAGPWFCCCTGLRLVNLVAASTQDDLPPTCCCGSSRQQNQNKPEGQDLPADDNDPPGCPCHEQNFRWAALTSNGSATFVALLCLNETLDFGDVLVAGPLTSSLPNQPARRDFPIFPFVATDTLLNHFHILRC